MKMQTENDDEDDILGLDNGIFHFILTFISYGSIRSPDSPSSFFFFRRVYCYLDLSFFYFRKALTLWQLWLSRFLCTLLRRLRDAECHAIPATIMNNEFWNF